MQYIYLKNDNQNKKGDIVEMVPGFWTEYYLQKGIIKKFEKKKRKKDDAK